jgi:(S)-2-hydroxyglutarate dehydrogenase
VVPRPRRPGRLARRVRVAVVGGGIVGLAAARLAAQRGHDVVLLEKEAELARHQTARNSGVVHAVLYYEPGSLKARLCRRGAGLLRELCDARGLPYLECGKVLVATEPAEVERLQAIAERATANGVPGIALLDAAGLRAVEPHARGVAALHSPTTAITDFRAVALVLAGDLAGAGGDIRTGARVARVAGGRVELVGGEVVTADRVLVCAGLQADRLARASGEPASPRIVPFRGEYWALRPERRDLVRGLIYPVPDPALPFLGVHLTRTVAGEVLVGPNAVLALAREGYRRRTVAPADVIDALGWPGTRRLLLRHLGAAGAEAARSASRALFVRAARRYVPELRGRDVVRAPAGVRAQAVDEDGALVDDFRLARGGGVTWVRNAPSPAATSSLAIAEELAAGL